MTVARCVSTVLRLMLSKPAMCLFVWPSAISWTTPASRFVSVDPIALDAVTNDFSNASETLVVKNGLWTASASMAAIKSRQASDLSR